MKKNKILITVACAGLLVSCAAAVPKELLNAREAYQRASSGSTANIAPAELHVANLALDKAEQSFKENPESYMTRDLAYLAERKTQIAEATASITIEQENKSQANSDYRTAQGNALSKTKQDLSQTNRELSTSARELSASEREGKLTTEQLAAEKKARLSAEQQAADAMAALAKLAAVKEEPRGTVITLSGSVLFASGKTELLPEARSRLDQVAEVLLTTRDRHLVVEGHTDSQGSERYNMDLSQRRANAVRNYLVQEDYQADRIQARGLGEGQPVADNNSAEGRANNRRVEIIIERESHVSNK